MFFFMKQNEARPLDDGKNDKQAFFKAYKEPVVFKCKLI